MNNLDKQINSVIQTTNAIADKIDKEKNFSLIPEFINLLEVVVPNIFLVNNNIELFNNEDIINILDDIINAYENKDSVLMTDVLIYGLNALLNDFLKELNKFGGSYE